MARNWKSVGSEVADLVSAGEWAAIIAASTGVVAVVLVAVLVVSLRRTLDEAKAAIAEARVELIPLLKETRVAVQEANSGLSKVDDLLSTAHSVTGTVDSASRFAFSVFSNPVIKGAALASGVARGAKSLRNHKAAK